MSDKLEITLGKFLDYLPNRHLHRSEALTRAKPMVGGVCICFGMSCGLADTSDGVLRKDLLASFEPCYLA